jgi:DNA polymerase-1
MIVVDAPGFQDDETGRPMVGRVGSLLDESLAAIGFNRRDFYITNLVKCRPMEKQKILKIQEKACRHYLDDEIEAVKPEFILTMGNTALSVVKKSGIMKHRGNVLPLGDAQVFPTIHPAAVLRNPRNEMLWKTDLEAFARLVKGESGATPTRTYLVNNQKTLNLCLDAILKSKAVAYDLETNGFEEYVPGAKIATISVSPKPGVAFVVPIHHPEAPWKQPERVLGAITTALAYTPAKRVAHNAKFDDRWLHQFGKPVYADFDTMLAAHIMDENRLKGLKPLAQMLLGVDAWANVDLAKGGAMVEDLKKLAKYNGKDSDYTLRLYYKFKEQLTVEGNERSLRIFTKIMMPASRCLTDIERTGMWLDQERMAERLIEINRRLEKLTTRLTKLAGEEVNWNSSQQMSAILFGKLKLPVIEMTDGGAFSTKESVLLRLRDKHEIVPLILEWRGYAKNRGFLEGWGELLDGNSRLHANYKLAGTVTGRLSSGKEEGNRGRGLNMQQVPRDPLIRSILGAPPGWRFVEADFSQIELRIAAHYSGDQTLQRLYQLGEDVHMQMAVSMTGKPASEVTKEERKKAKAVNFGFLYGMGAKKFVEYARDSYDVEVSLEEAKIVRDRYFEKFAGILPWHQRQRRIVHNYKRVQSLIGRVRHLTDIDSEDEDVQAEAERQAINSPVQSLASDLMLLSLVTLHDEMDPEEALIVGTVHDSILFQIREDTTDKWTSRIKEVMENLPLKKKFGVELEVPIVVDIKVGQHWSEGEEI